MMENKNGWAVIRKMVAGQIAFEPCRGRECIFETLGLFETEGQAEEAIRAFMEKEEEVLSY